MTSGRKSKIRWGWVAFSLALALSIAAGAAAGVLLGGGGGGGEGGVRRVAALALDTSRLSDDALALSRAIEEAVAREALESEGEALRTDLTRLRLRASRLRTRTEAQLVSYPVTRPAAVDSGTGGRVRRSLRQIESTLEEFERNVVSGLDSVLSSEDEREAGEAEEAASREELASVTAALERQGETLDGVIASLGEIEGQGESAPGLAGGREADDSVQGDFDGALVEAGVPLEVHIEIEGLEAEAREAGTEPATEALDGVASGRLALTDAAPSRDAAFELPALAGAREATVEVEPEATEPEAVAGEAEAQAEATAAGEGEAACRYEVQGERYCALMSFLVGTGDAPPGSPAAPPQEVRLRPYEDVVADAFAPASSLLVPVAKVAEVSDFLDSARPDLVQVVADGARGDLRPACAAEGEGGGEEEGATTLGLIDGEGTPVFEASEPNRPFQAASAAGSLPACYSLPYE
jgi:hypothetical protein